MEADQSVHLHTGYCIAMCCITFVNAVDAELPYRSSHMNSSKYDES